MNKNAIKKFAIEARQKLIASVTDKAGMLGITAEGVSAPTTKGNDFEVYQTAAGTEVTLNKKQCEQRRRLVEQIETKGFEEVVEEVAYTWFNRICAIRFMEVNDYLPSRVRALSSEKEGKNEPDLVTQAPDVDLDLTDAEKEFVIESKIYGKLDELFALLFIKQCNKLHEVLPELFEETSDYTEMLLCISFTNKDEVVRMLVDEVPEKDFDITTADENGNVSGQVEIIGWLYQYYISEPKDELINAHKQYKKTEIPIVTQLFTSDWIVKYIVENSLGRLLIENQLIDEDGMEYYFNNGNVEISKIELEQIKIIDPCMGSGHMLVYAFDLLMQAYLEKGYTAKDAVRSIISNNLYGLDIDKRAYQLSYFSIMMKARQYSRRVLNEHLECNINYFEKIEVISSENLKLFGKTFGSSRQVLTEKLLKLIEEFRDSNVIGSLIRLSKYDTDMLRGYLEDIESDSQISFDFLQSINVRNKLLKMLKIADILQDRYEIVITNPPYLNSRYMPSELKKYLESNYPEMKSDTFSAFIRRATELCMANGHVGLLTPYVWMFIAGYEDLRKYLLKKVTFSAMVQLEYNAFEAACVPVCAFTMRNCIIDMNGSYVRLSDFKGIEVQAPKTKEAKQNHMCGYYYFTSQKVFSEIPGFPIAYWVTEGIVKAFQQGTPIGKFAVARNGMKTGDNAKFLRLWWEISDNKLCLDARNYEEAKESNKKWFPYNKGGAYRKWYGNNDYVVNWENEGYEIFSNAKIDKRNVQDYPAEFKFIPSISWSLITSSKPSFRMKKNNLSDIAGMSLYPEKEDLLKILALLNSPAALTILNLIAPTINFQAGDIARIPFLETLRNCDELDSLTSKCIEISREDWDMFETSWDFKVHPFVRIYKKINSGSIRDLFAEWEKETEQRSKELAETEKLINEIILKVYGLENEMQSYVARDELVLYQANIEEDVRSLISFAIGCMFGRYSIDDEQGANNANNNILVITDKQYFQTDIVSKFCDWIRDVFGENDLETNLDYIAANLGNKGDSSREVIRNYFLKNFMDDHIKRYQKRPIYWMFDSGKEDGFKALIYMKAYSRDTVGIVRTDYLHKTQKAIEQAVNRAEYIKENAENNIDKKKAVQQITKYTKQLAQMKLYDEAMAHIANQRIEIDLDDGVKVNYEKFQGVEVAQEGKKALKIDLLAKIK